MLFTPQAFCSSVTAPSVPYLQFPYCRAHGHYLRPVGKQRVSILQVKFIP